MTLLSGVRGDGRKYESGAVGSFMHVVALQGHNYSCELEVYADGYQFKCAPIRFARLPTGTDRLTDVSLLCVADVGGRQAGGPVRAADAVHPAPGL